MVFKKVTFCTKPEAELVIMGKIGMQKFASTFQRSLGSPLYFHAPHYFSHDCLMANNMCVIRICSPTVMSVICPTQSRPLQL